AAGSSHARDTTAAHVTARRLVVFLQLVLFRGWRPTWWPLAKGPFPENSREASCGRSEGGRGRSTATGAAPEPEPERDAPLSGDEPASECFHTLEVALTPLVLSLLNVAHTSGTLGLGGGEGAGESARCSSAVEQGTMAVAPATVFAARVEDALLRSVEGQLWEASRQSYGDQGWAVTAATEVDDRRCLCHPRLPYVRWAARLVQAGSGAAGTEVARRVFRAWGVGLRSPSLPLKQHVCAELSRLLDGALAALDLARGPGGGVEATVAASQHLRRCLDGLPLRRLRSLARRRLLKEAEDEPMMSRVLQALIDLVATAELAEQVLNKRGLEEGKEVGKDKKLAGAGAGAGAGTG
ncbi:unnamed protein product, partial [Discosporangium mesarthrocarpum]